MGDGYTKENKLSKKPGPFIIESAVFDAAMNLLKFHRRFIICRPKLRFEWFDIRNRAGLFVKISEMDARESLPCSKTITGSMDIKVEVEQNRYIFTYIKQTQNVGVSIFIYLLICLFVFVCFFAVLFEIKK